MRLYNQSLSYMQLQSLLDAHGLVVMLFLFLSYLSQAACKRRNLQYKGKLNPHA
jgi:hypothetical protein